MLPQNFLTDTAPLRGENAVAAIITDENGRYLMQLRDDKPGIFYPGHRGCFGGAVGTGEEPVKALIRELNEELEMRSSNIEEFVSLEFDLARMGQKKSIVPITGSKSQVTRLHNSSCMKGWLCGSSSAGRSSIFRT